MFFNAAKVVCGILKKDSALKRYAMKTIRRKGTRAKKLAYSIVAAKMARIVYAIIHSGTCFVAEPTTVPGMAPARSNSAFTVTERKEIKNTRRLLRRLGIVKGLGRLGLRAEILASELDKALKENY